MKRRRREACHTAGPACGAVAHDISARAAVSAIAAARAIRHRACTSCLRVEGLGLRVSGLGFRVQGFRGLGFRVQGLGFRV